ncbi:family 20 glycosylhydrolase [Maribacter sp. ACAM166]|uniref:family 20 glycosylhydrolase n=1 Tax=Maribacter sp. ACAM166 TaxID=2508996 RepID=UPI00148527AA|nr:family 20 glycosylhydrolase [Maribacter sp. ACAM166]
MAQDFNATAKGDDNAIFQSKFSSEELKNARVKLIPFPQNVQWGKEQLNINNLQVKPSKLFTSLLNDELKDICAESGIQLIDDADFQLKFSFNQEIPEEGYELDITKEGIHISSSTETGNFYALQTLRQLIEIDNNSRKIQPCKIRDEPAYPIRGFMIDVGRNFQSIALLKKQLDIMAKYKMNTFHWHLTDDPAWRIESVKYPQLVAFENHLVTRDPGKYYTYNEIRELILYANKKKISVIPEIDMPGHSDSFTKTLGYSMESPEGMKVLENILNEFFKEIPKELAPIIHIGSDETHIKNPEEFITKMVSIVEGDNRKVMIWSPGLEAKKSVIRQTWGSADAVQGDFEEIDSRLSYINAGEPMTQINRLLFKPIGADSKNKILGGIICLWPDVNVHNENDVYQQNPVYSSLLTYAWSTWTADITSSPAKYRFQVPPISTEAGAYFKTFEQYLLAHKHRYFKDEPFQYFSQNDKHWQLIGPFNGNDGDNTLMNQKSETYLYKNQTLAWIPATGNTLIMKQRWVNTGYFSESEPGQTVYARTYVYSDTEKVINAWINFETPARSNRVYSGIPKNGELDANGGMISINGTQIAGPKWQNPGWKTTRQQGWGLPIEQETPWANEELYWLRKPTSLHLKKGWNKIFVKIPYKTEFQNWMFTFIPLDMDGLLFSIRED